jgi:hypothetical protein
MTRPGGQAGRKRSLGSGCISQAGAGRPVERREAQRLSRRPRKPAGTAPRLAGGCRKPVRQARDDGASQAPYGVSQTPGASRRSIFSFFSFSFVAEAAEGAPGASARIREALAESNRFGPNRIQIAFEAELGCGFGGFFGRGVLSLLS